MARLVHMAIARCAIPRSRLAALQPSSHAMKDAQRTRLRMRARQRTTLTRLHLISSTDVIHPSKDAARALRTHFIIARFTSISCRRASFSLALRS